MRVAVEEALVGWDALRGASILVTGGTGFVGCSLLEQYVEAWDAFRLGGSLWVLTRNAVAFRRREPRVANHPSIRLIEGDQTTFELPHSVDFVIHAAVTYGAPHQTLEHNLRGTMHVLDHAQSHGARRVLFTSSGAVYGPQPQDIERIVEDYSGAPPFERASSYGEMKRVCELTGLLRSLAGGCDFLIARCFAFVGPRVAAAGASAIGQFIQDALAGRPVHVRGDGTPVRSYMHSDDLARWLWTILLNGISGRPYNVGSETAVCLREVAATVARVVGTNCEIIVSNDDPKIATPRQRYVPSTARARRELSVRETIGLEEGIRRTAEWMRNQPHEDAR